MLFSSIYFLFRYLPIVVFFYFTTKKSFQNIFLLLASLFFYAWGGPKFALLMVASIVGNYFFGLLLGRKKSRAILILAVATNLLLLFFFKYLSFFTSQLNSLIPLPDRFYAFSQAIILPIGISFFTFQAMSYCIDIYQDKVVPQKNFINLALYISFFPQLIAGPIVRYIDINKEIEEREETFKDFQEGLERFIIGLSKKVLIANVFAKVADRAFGIPLGEQEFLYSLIGAFAYTFQIFFDFSGYSDMAIGLGRMFGFHFQENFRYPYSALSMKEFWRRWHISLSTWFRDYLYIPLGGNRGNIVSTGFNLLLVFTLCGLWHGANWTFLIWGLWHGLFLVLERSTFGELITRAPFFIQKVYTMFVIVVGWIFFRAESLRLAMDFFSSFGIFSNSSSSYTLRYLVSNEVVFIFLISVCISSERIVEKIRTILATRLSESLASFLRSAFLLVLLYLSSAKLALGTYNPFIYFRF